MLEPASANLVRLLHELRLCTPADWRRCRPRVRRMTHDLPAFDSVWIDALVQLRRLTPFQAHILESAAPERLRVGPFVLIDRLGGGSTGQTYLARTIQGQDLIVVKQLTLHEDLLLPTAQRVAQQLQQGRQLAHPHIVVPQAAQIVDQRLVIVSRYIPGQTLTELLVRRGRFPASVVLDIGRQLLDGLSHLHACGIAHGDIRPGTVRLQASGVVVLVDAALQPALEPELTPHSQLAPERYDCVAPELIGTGNAASVQSDLYALGCLLWQLLAGRPPFPGGDPLGKLAAHQTKRIRDVRDFAPDTPAVLAEGILRLTARAPQDRPAHAGQLLAAWKTPRYSTRNRLARFAAQFKHQIAGESSGKPSLAAWLLVLLFAVSGLALGLADQGARNRLLQIWPKEWFAAASVTSPTETVPTPDVEDLLPLPDPDPQGVIELDSPGPYLARQIRTVGPLVIRASQVEQAEIRVTDQSLALAAMSVTLEGLTIRRSDQEGQSSVSALVKVQSQTLTVKNSRLITHDLESRTGAPPTEWPQAVAWKVTDPSDPTGGTADWENVIVSGYGAGLDLRSTARTIRFQNVLRLGPGVLLHLAAPASEAVQLHLEWEHVTCRSAGSAICWDVRERVPAGQELKLLARNCVWDLIPEQSAICEFLNPAEADLTAWPEVFSLDGEACLKPPEVWLVARSQSGENVWHVLDDSRVSAEGLFSVACQFAGPLGTDPATSRIRGDLPQMSLTRSSAGETHVPGIVSEQLPGGRSLTAARQSAAVLRE